MRPRGWRLVALACLAAAPAAAKQAKVAQEDPGVEIAARVAIEPPVDRRHWRGDSDWVEFHVEGGGIASIERCERLVEAEVKRVYPGTELKPRVVRACAAAALPPVGHPAIDASILRVQEPLPTLDVFAIASTPTTGRVVRYTRMLSAVECERRRESLNAQARGEAGQRQARTALDEQLRLNAEQIRKACEARVPTTIPNRNTPRPKHRVPLWASRDEARSRCEAAKQMGEVLARKRAEQAPAEDLASRVCVRDGGP